MTWTKLSDDFGDECWTLSDSAFRLLVEMLNYSNRKLLDLSIPKDELRRFAKNPDAITELVSGEWCADDGDHWLILFHGLYQPSRADVLRTREANRANGRRGGRPAISAREHTPITHPLSHSLSEPLTHRDGTGLDKEALPSDNEIGLVDEYPGDSPGDVSWPIVDIPTASEPTEPRLCRICKLPMHPAVAASGSHPNCEPVAS